MSAHSNCWCQCQRFIIFRMHYVKNTFMCCFLGVWFYSSSTTGYNKTNRTNGVGQSVCKTEFNFTAFWRLYWFVFKWMCNVLDSWYTFCCCGRSIIQIRYGNPYCVRFLPLPVAVILFLVHGRKNLVGFLTKIKKLSENCL